MALIASKRKQKKSKSLLNRETEKKKKPNREKNRLNFKKKPTSSIWFQFYKPETEKIKPNPNRQKIKP